MSCNSGVLKPNVYPSFREKNIKKEMLKKIYALQLGIFISTVILSSTFFVFIGIMLVFLSLSYFSGYYIYVFSVMYKK